MKKQKGITLIALIITIIVMLILVGVSINVALNGGLFNNAKEASKKTQIEAEKERLLGFVLQAYDAESGEVDFGKLNTILDAEGWTVGPNGTYTSPSGNTIFVNKNGKIEDKEDTETDPDLETLKRYVLGKNLTGRDISEITDNFFYNGKFKNDPETIADAETSVEYVDTDGIGYCAKYKGKLYVIDMDSENYEMTKDVIFLYEPKGKEGQDLGQVLNDSQYSGWTILYDHENGKYEAVSSTGMGNLTLGDEDSVVNWNDSNVIAEANIDGIEGLSSAEKGLYSYNHAIETINAYCNTLTLPTNTGVRSVGVKKGLEKMYSDLNTWTTNETLINTYNNKIKTGELEGKHEEVYKRAIDLFRMSYWNIGWSKTNNFRYWIAFRELGSTSDGNLGLRVMNVRDHYYQSDYLCAIGDFFIAPYGSSTTRPVRPIITVVAP